MLSSSANLRQIAKPTHQNFIQSIFPYSSAVIHFYLHSSRHTQSANSRGVEFDDPSHIPAMVVPSLVLQAQPGQPRQVHEGQA